VGFSLRGGRGVLSTPLTPFSGEYAERIDNADELLAEFMETFKDESAQVQLQLLTAVVKLFLKRPKTAQQMVTDILAKATQEVDNPDLRDRGYLYWRLLSTDPDAAKQVVLAQKPLISENTDNLDPTVLEEVSFIKLLFPQELTCLYSSLAIFLHWHLSTTSLHRLSSLNSRVLERICNVHETKTMKMTLVKMVDLAPVVLLLIYLI